MASDLEVKPIGLSDLPDDILIYIWRHLGPLDLVSLTRQDVRCGRLAKSPELWRRICQQRWPNCKMEEAYEGDMYLMYRTRLGYPPGFLVSVDNVLGLQQGSAPSFHIINRLMKSVFSIGLEVCKLPDLRQTREYKKYAETVLACLSSRPEAFVAFVEQARSTLEEFDMWQAAFVGWPETPWKRSAVAFLLEVMGEERALAVRIPAGGPGGPPAAAGRHHP
eukprot:jgi/Botrbrau1/14059/Bobra.182_3s0006.1